MRLLMVKPAVVVDLNQGGPSDFVLEVLLAAQAKLADWSTTLSQPLVPIPIQLTEQELKPEQLVRPLPSSWLSWPSCVASRSHHCRLIRLSRQSWCRRVFVSWLLPLVCWCCRL